MKIYALGGLGADKRTFTYLNLKNHKLVCLEWLDPKPNESLKDFATRTNELIPEENEIGLLGVSFGGMIMSEVAKLRKPKHTILISSVPVASELRGIYRAAGWLKLDRAFPYNLMVKSGRFTPHLFGVKKPKDKELLKSILDSTDLVFLKWALRAILSWKNEEHIKTVRIHGTRDLVLPVAESKIDYPLKKAGHFIIVIEADKISKIIDGLE